MKVKLKKKELINLFKVLNENYFDDQYLRDNDIYDYIPTDKEIEMFNKIDKPQKLNFPKDEYDPNSKLNNPHYNSEKKPKFKREVKNRNIKYTGRAKIIYTYPNGKQEDVKNSIGPIAVVKNKLKNIQNQTSTNDAPFYSIKFETTHNLFENINPNEAYDNFNSVKTIVDGKRNVATININNNDDKTMKLIGVNKLKLLKVTSNKYNMYIIYRDGYQKQAMELKNIADKYNGFLSYNASDEDTYKIGKLLGYNENDILKYINKKNKNVMTESQYNYHIGDIEDTNNVKPYMSDNKYRMTGRDTGHFGSGLYFSTYKCYDNKEFDDKNINNQELIKIKDKVYRTDFDIYKNLYKVTSKKHGDILFQSLKQINQLYQQILDYFNHNIKLSHNFSEIYVITKNNFKYLNLNMPKYADFIKMCINQTKNQDLRSMSTVIMEYNNYNGVNVSGIYFYDNTLHGSVIYDMSKVSDNIKPVDTNILNICDIDKSNTNNYVAGTITDFTKKLLMDKNSIEIYTDEFNQMPYNEQLYAINKYKFPLTVYTLNQLNQNIINAYFKSLPKKINNKLLLQKLSQKHIEAILFFNKENIIYNPNIFVDDNVTFLEYALDKLEYSDYIDKLIDNINRPLTNNEQKMLNYIKT